MAIDDGSAQTEAWSGAIARELNGLGLTSKTTIWAGEHAYIAYNRRYAQMHIIGVYAAQVGDAAVRLDPSEHSEYAWLPYATNSIVVRVLAVPCLNRGAWGP